MRAASARVAQLQAVERGGRLRLREEARVLRVGVRVEARARQAGELRAGGERRGARDARRRVQRRRAARVGQYGRGRQQTRRPLVGWSAQLVRRGGGVGAEAARLRLRLGLRRVQRALAARQRETREARVLQTRRLARAPARAHRAAAEQLLVGSNGQRDMRAAHCAGGAGGGAVGGEPRETARQRVETRGPASIGSVVLDLNVRGNALLHINVNVNVNAFDIGLSR